MLRQDLCPLLKKKVALPRDIPAVTVGSSHPDHLSCVILASHFNRALVTHLLHQRTIHMLLSLGSLVAELNLNSTVFCNDSFFPEYISYPFESQKN